MAVSIVTAVMVLGHPDIGGISGLVEKVPSHHFDWTAVCSSDIVWLWVIGTFVHKFVSLNNMQDSYRYLNVKDEKQSRKAALLASGLMLIGPIIWFIPPMAARVLSPDLAVEFPEVKNPNDTAYIFAAMQVLPSGMMGLLVCGLFAATISSMDSGLNRNAGIFVRCFYQHVVKDPSPRHLLRVGQLASAVFGVFIILIAIFVNQLKGLDLFDLMMYFGGMIAVPYSIPLLWVIILKKTPPWSGWSTVLIGFAISIALTFSWDVTLEDGGETVTKYLIDPSWFGTAIGIDGEMSTRERKDYLYFTPVYVNVVVCTVWFFFTRLFYGSSTEEHKQRVEKFFTDMNTPIDFEKEVGAGKDSVQSKTLGILCMIYGGFVLLMVLVPNDLSGRAAFLFCGGLIAGVGWLLFKASKKSDAAEALKASSPGG
jgi:Na+/proline symporter